MLHQEWMKANSGCRQTHYGSTGEQSWPPRLDDRQDRLEIFENYFVARTWKMDDRNKGGRRIKDLEMFGLNTKTGCHHILRWAFTKYLTENIKMGFH